MFEPVADHEYPASGSRERGKRCAFALGRRRRLPLGDAERARRLGDRGRAVSRNQEDAVASALQRRDRLGGVGTQSVMEGEADGGPARLLQPQLGLRVVGPSLHAAEGAAPEPDLARGQHRAEAAAGVLDDSGKGWGTGTGALMPARRGERGRKTQIQRRDRCLVDKLEPAQGHRAGLVEDDGVDGGELLERRRRFQEDTAAHQPAAGDHLQHRHRQTERARTSDDEDRHRVEEGRLPRHEEDSRGEGRERGRCTAGA